VLNLLYSTSDYIPGREALFVKVDLSNYLIDYYLHRKDVVPKATPEQDEKLKELIACFAIHLAAKSPVEEHAWSVHLVSADPYSLFVTGSTGVLDPSGKGTGAIVGNVLTENIRHTDVNSLHAQVVTKDGSVFKSYVSSEEGEISKIVEAFYKQSEQNPLRINYSLTTDVSTGLIALPKWDRDWFRTADLQKLDTEENLKRMRDCGFEFKCDCSPQKLLPYFRSLDEKTLEELYGEDKELIITCPRCGEHFAIDWLMLSD